MPCSTRRPAFTLVELLVVIAIIGVLIALLLPAVQKVRAAAGRVKCANNMKQMGIALHHYHDVYGTFPNGMVNDNEAPPNGYHPEWSWMALLLEFYEEGNLYRLADDWAHQPGGYYQAFGDLGTPPNPAVSTVVKLWTCPADDRTDLTGTGITDTGKQITVAFTEYLGINGIEAPQSISFNGTSKGGEGILYHQSRIRIAQILDGTSNTLIVGERPPSADLNFGWWFGSDGKSFLEDGTGEGTMGAFEEDYFNATLKGSPYNCKVEKLGFQPGNVADNCDQAHFWSLHSGGANFLLADGSVRFLTYGLDVATFQALCTRAGGEVLQNW